MAASGNCNYRQIEREKEEELSRASPTQIVLLNLSNHVQRADTCVDRAPRGSSLDASISRRKICAREL